MHRTPKVFYPALLVVVSACCSVMIEEAYWTPTYFCTGDRITLHYKANNCLDKVVISSGGSVDRILGESNSHRDEIETPPINSDYLPIRVSGKANDQWKSITHRPTICDSPHLTESYNLIKPDYWPSEWFGETEVFWKNEHQLTLTGQREVSLSSGGTTTVNVYQVTDVILGFIFDVPDHF